MAAPTTVLINTVAMLAMTGALAIEVEGAAPLWAALVAAEAADSTAAVATV